MKKVSALTILGIIASLAVSFFINCQQTAVTSAKVYMQQSNYDKAIEQCKAAIKQMPNNAEAYFVLGEAYGQKRMHHEMNEAFKKSLQFSQNHAQEIKQERLKYWVGIFNSGVALTKQNKPREAIKKFSLAAELLPDKTESYKNLAYAYSIVNDDSSAIQTYLKAIKIDPNDLELKDLLGLFYYRAKQYKKAIEVLKEVIAKADPTSKVYKDAIYNLAYSYDFTGQSDKALETYRSALKAAPEDKDLLFNMGRLYFMQKNYDMAIEKFQEVIKIDSTDFDANLDIGNAYLQLEKFKEAIPYFEKATQLKPDNANAWNNLGVAYVRAGFPKKGKAAFDKADELKGVK